MSKLKRLNAVLLCSDEALGFKVLYCLANLGAATHILGRASNKLLKISRWCHRYVPVSFPESPSEIGAFTDQLNSYAEHHAIDVFVPSDEVAADCLAQIQDGLTHSKCYPVIDKAQFDALHDKWNFAQLLTKNGIPTPITELIADPGDVTREHLARVGFPMMVKPLAMWGRRGVVKIDDFDELESYLSGDSPDNNLPLIAQQFIPGDDMDLSVLAIEGKVIAWTAQRWVGREVLEFIENDEMVEIGRKIARSYGLHGVAHFDMRKDARNNSFVVIECNPRFWQSLPASMWHGVNFVELGIGWALNGRTNAQQNYRPGLHYQLEALLEREFWMKSIFKTFSKENLRAYKQELLDPLPLMIEIGGGCRGVLRKLFKSDQ